MTDALLEAMQTKCSSVMQKTFITQFQPPFNQQAVLAEFSVTSTELHKIANGDCCVLNDGLFGVRFLLKKSFKSGRSDFVINQYVIQVVANGKSNAMKKEDIAMRTKVVKGRSKVKKKEFEEVKLEVNNNDEELF